MHKLILVRHSLSLPEPILPPSQWPLSEAGQARCVPLALYLAEQAPTLIVTSTERKAIETGNLLAGKLHLPCRQAHGIEEHDRSSESFEPSNNRFRQRIAEFFAQPSQLVYGIETADDCYSRFSDSVKVITAEYPEDTIVIVTHGTVMSLFTTRHSEHDAFVFWQRLQMPGFVVFTLPDLRVSLVRYAVTEDKWTH